MDAAVDDRLGDDILYKRPIDPAPVARKAFLFFEIAAEGPGPRDSSRGRIWMKISKVVLKPALADRLTSPLLDREVRPVGPVTGDSRYWFVDLQAV